MSKYIGKKYYFNIIFLGIRNEGMLGGTVIKDGDETGEYPNHFFMRGVYTNRDVWISKDILKHKDTKEIK